jgi:hypothetical protein
LVRYHWVHHHLTHFGLRVLILGAVTIAGCAPAATPTGPSATTPTTGVRAGPATTPAAAEVAGAIASLTTVGSPVPSGTPARAATVLTGAARNVTIPIVDLNASGINGTATLIGSESGRTRVQILVTGSTDVHPAHFHNGRCSGFDPAPKWPLEPIRNGTSTTDLNVPFDEVTRGGTVINLHRSQQDETPVACGNLEPIG